MTGCFCIGPQNGALLCPCAMRRREGDLAWELPSQADPNKFRMPDPGAVPNTGWKCPVCGKGNAPFMPTCGNQLCGVDLSKGATA
jgi:hypothetical protein